MAFTLYQWINQSNKATPDWWTSFFSQDAIVLIPTFVGFVVVWATAEWFLVTRRFNTSLTRYKRGLIKMAIPLILVSSLGGTFAFVAHQFGGKMSVQGYVNVASDLQGADVSVYYSNSDGSKLTLVGSTTTDKTGFYQVDIIRPPDSSLVIVAGGGTYIDEITGKTIALQTGEVLDAAIPTTVSINYAGHLNVTPLTSMAAGRALIQARDHRPLVDAIRAANAGVARQYNLRDIIRIDPAIVTDGVEGDPQNVHFTLRENRQYGMVLAGLDQEAKTIGVAAIALSMALLEDLQDGILDGKYGSKQVMINDPPRPPAQAATGGRNGIAESARTVTAKNYPLPPGAGTTGAQTGCTDFAGMVVNQSNLSQPCNVALPQNIGLNGGGIFYVGSGALPAFYEGESASVPFDIVGGQQPIGCSITGGQPPTGFVVHGCVLVGNPPLMGGGTSMRISAPFQVTIREHGGNQTFLDIQVTIVQRPPVVTGHNATCEHARQPCARQLVATATGGTSPFRFETPFGENPPLGMVVDFNGFIGGKPVVEGRFPFRVCAVDLAGNYGCSGDARRAHVNVNALTGTFNYALAASTQGDYAEVDVGPALPPTPPPPPPPPTPPGPKYPLACEAQNQAFAGNWSVTVKDYEAAAAAASNRNATGQFSRLADLANFVAHFGSGIPEYDKERDQAIRDGYFVGCTGPFFR